MDKKGIFSSPDCINIPALYWNDGDTHVIFGPDSEIIKAGQPDFDGILNTGNKEIILFDALEPQFAIAHVPSEKTRIRIWMNHPTSPDQVVIPPFLTGLRSRIHAAIFSFCAGVMPPMPILGRSLL